MGKHLKYQEFINDSLIDFLKKREKVMSVIAETHIA